MLFFMFYLILSLHRILQTNCNLSCHYFINEILRVLHKSTQKRNSRRVFNLRVKSKEKFSKYLRIVKNESKISNILRTYLGNQDESQQR